MVASNLRWQAAAGRGFPLDKNFVTKPLADVVSRNTLIVLDRQFFDDARKSSASIANANKASVCYPTIHVCLKTVYPCQAIS